jgi:hypothetical protein
MPDHVRSTKEVWLFVSAVVWVATRDAALADSLVGQRGRWWLLASRAVRDRLGDPEAALVAAHDELRGALTSNRLRARSATGGSVGAIAAAAWAAPILEDDRSGVLVGATLRRAWDPGMFPPVPRAGAARAQPRGGWRTWCEGGAVPLFKPADVMRAFPPRGGKVQPNDAQRPRDPNMTERLIDIAKERARDGRSLIRVEGTGRIGVAEEMRAILAELPSGVSPSPSLLKKVLSMVHPTG